MRRIMKMPCLQYRDHPLSSVWNDVIRMVSVWTPFNIVIEFDDKYRNTEA